MWFPLLVSCPFHDHHGICGDGIFLLPLWCGCQSCFLVTTPLSLRTDYVPAIDGVVGIHSPSPVPLLFSVPFPPVPLVLCSASTSLVMTMLQTSSYPQAQGPPVPPPLILCSPVIQWTSIDVALTLYRPIIPCNWIVHIIHFDIDDFIGYWELVHQMAFRFQHKPIWLCSHQCPCLHFPGVLLQFFVFCFNFCLVFILSLLTFGFDIILPHCYHIYLPIDYFYLSLFLCFSSALCISSVSLL